jgi:hypothetical protein
VRFVASQLPVAHSCRISACEISRIAAPSSSKIIKNCRHDTKSIKSHGYRSYRRRPPSSDLAASKPSHSLRKCCCHHGPVDTTQTLRDNLQNLGVFAVTVKGDIDKVNVEFDTNYHTHSYLREGPPSMTPSASSSKLTSWSHATTSPSTWAQWGAKSPDDKKIMAMTAEINTLKGQVKLDPKLSAIAHKGEMEERTAQGGGEQGREASRKVYL